MYFQKFQIKFVFIILQTRYKTVLKPRFMDQQDKLAIKRK